MSNSVWPHRRQPTRLLCPWDSPGEKLEWVAISFSNAWKWKVKVKWLGRVQLFATLWTAAYQAPPSLGFSRQETGVCCHFLLQCMKVKRKVKWLGHVRLFATLWTAAYQAPPSMGFSRQEYWSGVPLPSPTSKLRGYKNILSPLVVMTFCSIEI